MSYALINRDDLHLECHFKSLELLQPEHRVRPYVVVRLDKDNPLPAFEEHKFSLLELQLLYRNLGTIPNTATKFKGSLAAACVKLIRFHVLSIPATAALFSTKTEAHSRPTVPDRPAANTVALAKPKVAPAGPATGNRLIIWKVADSLWEAAGKPFDIPTVLALRRQIMNVLETEHEVKRTTSSTALGQWQKERIA